MHLQLLAKVWSLGCWVLMWAFACKDTITLLSSHGTTIHTVIVFEQKVHQQNVLLEDRARQINALKAEVANLKAQANLKTTSTLPGMVTIHTKTHRLYALLHAAWRQNTLLQSIHPHAHMRVHCHAQAHTPARLTQRSAWLPPISLFGLLKSSLLAAVMTPLQLTKEERVARTVYVGNVPSQVCCSALLLFCSSSISSLPSHFALSFSLSFLSSFPFIFTLSLSFRFIFRLGLTNLAVSSPFVDPSTQFAWLVMRHIQVTPLFFFFDISSPAFSSVFLFFMPVCLRFLSPPPPFYRVAH